MTQCEALTSGYAFCYNLRTMGATGAPNYGGEKKDCDGTGENVGKE